MNSDGEFNMSRDQLKTKLRETIATVTFAKADGTLRQMKCTLSENHLPTFEENKSTRKENLDVLPVWDIEKGEWRSFRIDSIKSVSFA
jgi:hypothetical protein